MSDLMPGRGRRSADPQAIKDQVGRRLRVIVPATSANLGPGFDALGLSLNWTDESELEVTEAGCEISVSGEGEHSVPRDRSHLLIRSLDLGLADLGLAEPVGVRLSAVNTIPHGSGLGSSAAAVVAGLSAAWALAMPGEPLDRQWLLQLATALEGHPDNVAAAIFGGFVMCYGGGDERVHAVSGRVDYRSAAAAYVPTDEVSTKAARGVLPTMIPRADAVANSGRAALLVHALASEPELLFVATKEWLHQQYRAALMPRSAGLVELLRSRGFGAVISGAGPTVLVLGSDDQLDDLNGDEAPGFAFHRLSMGPAVRVVG